MLKTVSTLFIFVAAIASAFAAGDPQAAPARPAAVSHQPAAGPVKAAASHAPASSTLLPAEQTALVKQYCVACHNDRSKAGQLSLQSFDAATLEEHGELAEKMIRKVRSGMMPPSGARRPEPHVLSALLNTFESRMDKHAALNPNPGSRPFQRLNRAEYTNAVRDLLNLDVDVSTYLPPDTISHGFDNVADAQTFSPTLMDGYLRAASQISRLAVGDRNASATSATYKIPRAASQMRRVRRGADGHARWALSGACLPCGWPLPTEGVAALRTARGPRRPQHDDRLRPEGTGRVLGQRRARGDLRSQHAHERDRSEERPRAGDAAGAHQGRPAARDRRLRPEVGRPG